MSIGIDKIGFATSQYVLKMADLALARGAEPEKFSKGLMLDATSITPITEDIVTLASDAAADILNDDDKKAIDMVIVATESSIDQSKAAAVYVHSLLGIQPFARSFEMKEASDIARYGVGSSGESTQGAGAVAMLVSQNPRILELADDNVAQTRDVMDFWRPNYSSTPYVQGIYSTKQYLDSLKTTWAAYQERHQADFADFAAFCLHLPYPKLALKGLNKIIPKDLNPENKERLTNNFDASITYSRQIGNIYTGSLYLGLLSLLEQSQDLKAGDKIGFFSYGSGAVSEIFSGRLVEGYKDLLRSDRLDIFAKRQHLSVSDYEKLFYEEAQLDDTGSTQFADYQTGAFRLAEISEHQHIYKGN